MGYLTSQSIQIQHRPLRLMVYTDAAGIGGAEISLGHLIATASPDLEIAVVGVSPSVINAIADRRPHSSRLLLPDQKIASGLAHWLTFRRWQPDIIHFNLCTPWAGAIGLAVALTLPRVRVVRVDQLPLRTTDAMTLWRTRALSLRVDAHVAVGEASARRMEDFYALGRDTVISIPNGVPDGFTIPAYPIEAATQPMRVGSIGRLNAMKGHDLLLQAIAQVEHVTAVILGEGEQRSTLEKLAVDLGIRDRVTFAGWVDDPRSYLPQFDVVALPSRSEGFPLAMIEAMLAARPLIASRVGSMPEAIINGKTGILIEKNNVSDLARALRDLRDDPIYRIQLGKQARETAVAHFTVESMTAQYERLWSTVLMAPRKPRLQVPRPKD